VFRQGPKNPSIIKTNPKTNMFPENQWLEDVFPVKIVPFKGDMLVFSGIYPRISRPLYLQTLLMLIGDPKKTSKHPRKMAFGTPNNIL